MRHFFSKYTLLTLIFASTLALGYSIFDKISQKDITANLNALDQNEWENVIKNAVEKHVGKTLILPYTDSLYISEYSYQNICRLPLKIVAFIDGDCSTCLLKIRFWKEFISEMNSMGYNNIPVIFYTHSFFEENIRNYMNTEWLQYPWQFDKEKSFLNINELHDMRLQIVLLDSENKVLLIGDPLLNPKLRELYMKTIISLL